jgi:broad specificity phosphatase PhoE
VTTVTTKLLVVARHAESVRNVAKQGHVFFPDDAARDGLDGVPDHLAALTPRGVEQARALGLQLRAAFGTFDCVYHSGYRRARQTADVVVSLLDGPQPVVREHILLRERDAGYTVDMTRAEADASYPWLTSYWQSVGPVFSRPPGGESLADVAQRVQVFLDAARHELATRRVLIVSHVGTLRMLRFLVEGWSYDDLIRQWAASSLANAAFLSLTPAAEPEPVGIPSAAY